MGMWVFILAMMLVNILLGSNGAWFTAVAFDMLCQIGVIFMMGLGMRGEYEIA